MTALEHACSVLVVEGFAPGDTEEWLGQPTRGETEKSERAGRMVRALLAVASGT